MYEYISGVAVKITPKHIVIDNGGIGYLINVPNPYIYKQGDYYTVYVYLQIREDAHELYGFTLTEEKELFLQLISVTGIGPKTALPILAASSVDEIKAAISLGDAKYMQKFPGIGPKAAQQIILDLRGKIDFEQNELIPVSSQIKDCEEALIALGYNKKEVEKALGKVDQTKSQNEIIKDALKLLSRL